MRTKSILPLALLVVGLLMPLAAAEEAPWGSPESRTKELRITLKSGEVVQGRFNAETDDKVMMTVITPKGKNSQTVQKADVAKHEWVKPLEDEMREKLEAWPADKFEDLQTYGQDMIDQGYKKVYLDYMKGRQNDLTAEQFKLYVFLLLNNDYLSEAKALIAWAKEKHADWKAEIEEANGRLPTGPKLGDPSKGKIKDPSIPDLLPGQLLCMGKIPTNEELVIWSEDAAKHIPGASSVKYSGINAFDQADPDVLIITYNCSFDLSENKNGKVVRYLVGLIYTRRQPKIWAYKDKVIMPWVLFPKPQQ